jgi:hypothetical protein
MRRRAWVSRLTGSVLVVLWVLASGGRAHAESDCAARVAFVQAKLDADVQRWKLWRWGWGIGYTALAAGQVGLAQLSDDEGEQVELYVGAGKSILGLVPLFFDPLPAPEDAEALRASGSCADAERYLAASARNEAFARGWLGHVANVAVNGGGLLIVGIGYDRWVTGALGAVVGIAIGEVQTFTRPSASLKASWVVTPTVGAESAGLVLMGTF